MSKKENEMPTMKVMKADEQMSVSKLSKEERMQMAGELQKEIDSRHKEIETKYYIVQGGAAAGEKLLNFVKNEAQWKFTEAVGIVEMTKEIQKAIDKAKDGKDLFLQVLPLEALWFFINKVEGVGLEKAAYFHENLIKPVGEALSRVKNDREKINELMMRQGSLEAGADFEAEPASKKIEMEHESAH
jgi:hypothetical protein